MMGFRWLFDSAALRALLGLNVLALLAVFYLLIFSPSVTIDETVAATSEKIDFQPVKRPDARPELSTFTEKPIFHTSRERREVLRREVRQTAAAPAATIVPPSKSYRLSGIIGAADGSQIAYVSKTSSGETVRLKVGDIIEDWTVTAISRDQVNLSRESATDQLSLER